MVLTTVVVLHPFIKSFIVSMSQSETSIPHYIIPMSYSRQGRQKSNIYNETLPDLCFPGRQTL